MPMPVGITKAAVNAAQEHNRQANQQSLGLAQQYSETNWLTGVITDSHASARMIKAMSPESGPLLAGRWITLIHSVREICERWGEIRNGFSVLVMYRGHAGGACEAWAWIIGDENEYGPNMGKVVNDIPMGFGTSLGGA